MSSTLQNETVDSTIRLRCAFYGFFTTKVARPASIENQLQACRELAESKDWELLPEYIYKDVEPSGTKIADRIGLRALEAAAAQHPRPFDCILIDHTRSVGRSQAKVLNFTNLMAFYGVRVYFVCHSLDSSDRTFAVIVSAFHMMDHEFVDRLREKVFRAQKERVLQGFHVGSTPYGYRTLKTYDPDRLAVGRQSAIAVKLEIAEEQASIVRRIFHQFVDGHSIGSIRRQLDAENIPSPRSIRSGNVNAAWCNSAISRILRSPLVRGEIVWNVSGQTRNRLTGKVEKTIKPAHEHVRVVADNLRIVDDGLWFKAAQKLKGFEGVRRLVDA